tara:strand:+ start:1950 stop:2453 length:504 start_codon:yes stop_codon:yes gene_type:complete
MIHALKTKVDLHTQPTKGSTPLNYALLYISKATEPFSSDSLEQLAIDAQQRNQASNLTGLLLYSGTHFIQILEGDYHELNNLFESISRDKRHHSIKVLMGAPASERQFPDWSMGVIDISSNDRIDPHTLDLICAQAEGQPEATKIAALETLKHFQFDVISNTGAVAA